MSEKAAVPKYKLTYFGIKGRAEYIRYLFALAEVPYEDELIEFNEWPSKKASMPFNSIPKLDVNDGEYVINQSVAIGRVLAKRFGMAGKNPYEQALIDSYADGLVDAGAGFGKIRTHLLAQNAELAELEYREFKNTVLNTFMNRYENFIISNPTHSGWLVGDRISWADVAVAEFLEKMLILFEPDLLQDYPNLDHLVKRLMAIPAIQRRINSRPAHWKL